MGTGGGRFDDVGLEERAVTGGNVDGPEAGGAGGGVRCGRASGTTGCQYAGRGREWGGGGEDAPSGERHGATPLKPKSLSGSSRVTEG
jgi:hypothetical protein